MNREWRTGTIRLVPGYWLLDASGERVEMLVGVDFAIEGGYVNVRVEGRPDVQLVSAPGVAWMSCVTND